MICQSYWPTMESSMFISQAVAMVIRDVWWGMLIDFCHIFKILFLKKTLLKPQKCCMFKKKKKLTPTRRDKQRHTHIFFSQNVHKQQAAIQVPRDDSRGFCEWEMILQHGYRKLNFPSRVKWESQMSSQHSNDPQIITCCSGLRGVENHGCRNQIRDRQRGRQLAHRWD